MAQSNRLSNGAETTSPSNTPVLLDSKGRLTRAAFTFTTRAYQSEALRLVIQEANEAARQLELPEKLPIVETNLSQVFILGYGMSLMPPGMIGNVHTKDYGYFVSVGHKLSFVERERQSEDCRGWREHCTWSTNQIDTNGPYQIAVQWLAALSMDVKGLNSNCVVRVEPNSYWNNGLLRQGKFVPIYDVFWISPKDKAKGYGDTAFVSLFAPTKTLITLRVQDEKYILRRPLAFANLDYLLSQTNGPQMKTPSATNIP